MQVTGGKVQLVPYGLHRNPRNLSNSKGFRGFAFQGWDTFGTVSAGKVPKLARPSRARDALGYPCRGGPEGGTGISPCFTAVIPLFLDVGQGAHHAGNTRRCWPFTLRGVIVERVREYGRGGPLSSR